MKFIRYLFHGRTGKVEDVLIDSIGSTIGICVLLFIVKVVEIIKSNRKDVKNA